MNPDFEWPEPEDAVDVKLIADVKEYGCHVMNIFVDENGPEWSFSLAFYVNFSYDASLEPFQPLLGKHE